MAGPPRPTFGSIPSEPSLRRLGVGGSSTNERPMRAQLVVAITVGLMLVAVPLYLWRRPSLATHADAPAAVDAAKVAVAVAAKPLAVPRVARLAESAIKLEPIVRVSCGAAANRLTAEGDLCDRLPVFEEALTKAIGESEACVPKSAKAGSINYVLTVDFRSQRTHIFPGKSGEWKGPSARRITECVSRALPKVDMASVVHKYRYYVIAQLVRYPGPQPLPGAADAPLFE
ncbi:MAG: hypothetical protein SFV15_09535 [Polyangiaceae bacterium]|nr:hypothetical protein [Polyangiaceae bacterium]